MSSREPMWYCHECNAEMRPLMVPDPHCASCHGTFVEKMENPADDPREFHNFNGNGDGDTFGPVEFIASLQDLLRPESPGSTRMGRSQSPNTSRNDNGNPRDMMGLRFESTGSGGRRTFIIGGNNTLNTGRSEADPSAPPRLSEFLRSNEAEGNNPQDRRIPGPLMAQYLLSLLANGPRGMTQGLAGHPLFGPMGGAMFGGLDDVPANGRMGDYVFTQDALDQIITQIMEGANANRPVPATEEIMKNLPREVLLEDSALLEKDCAVCKEQFNAHDEEPDNQVVATLPCKHPFHEGCIMPWLKSSGTCPVCRFALVPQPQSHGANPASSSTNASGSHSSRPSPVSPRSPTGSHGTPPISPTLSEFFNSYLSPNGSGSSSASPRTRSNSDPQSQSSSNRSRSDRDNDREQHLPGRWGDTLD